MPNRLKDKVAMIVGAGSIGPGWGNGKATAVACAREGAKVFCVDINLSAAEETADIISGEGGFVVIIALGIPDCLRFTEESAGMIVNREQIQIVQECPFVRTRD